MTTPENEVETVSGKPQVVSPTAACNSNPPKSQNQQLPPPEPSGTLRNLQLLPLKAIFTSRNVRAKPARTYASRSLSKPSLLEPSLLEPFGEPDVSPRSVQMPLPGPCYTKTCMRRDLLGIFLIANVVAVYVSHAACLL